MAKNMLMKVGDEKVVIKLLWDGAPNLCQKIWENLPVAGSGHLAKVCSHEFIVMLPFMATRENLQDVTPGCVGWWDNRSAVNLWFDNPGPNGPLGKTALFGKVVGDSTCLAKEAYKIWDLAGQTVSFERYYEEK